MSWTVLAADRNRNDPAGKIPQEDGTHGWEMGPRAPGVRAVGRELPPSRVAVARLCLRLCPDRITSETIWAT